jgi:hypothetical protein
VSNAECGGSFSSSYVVYCTPAGGGAGPNSSSLLSEFSEGGLGGLSESGAGGADGPRTRVGFAGPGGAGPMSLSGLVDLDFEVGGSDGPRTRESEGSMGGGAAGPSTLRRFSPESGLEEGSSSSSRLRLARWGGSDGPTEGMVVKVSWIC